MSFESIRNFSIIAHIDHGKSTLADRFLELTGTVNPKEMREQVLDDMDLERERGITIKAHAIRMVHRYRGRDYVLNLIDTPGHVDFTYEVSRSLAACEGALLVVDATQGVEAQTLSNLYLALDNNLTIIPIVNKIDLPSAQVEEHREGLAELIGIDPSEVLLVSAKVGTGAAELLEAIIERIPAPQGDLDAPFSAMIFDSTFDLYRGVVAYVRIYDGELRPGDRIRLMSSGKEFEVSEVGVLRLEKSTASKLSVGDVGYVIAGVKRVADAKVGDTITRADRPRLKPLPGYREPKPMVYSGFYPVDSEEYPQLRDGLEKLKLNDASLVYEPETSVALGFGFRLGFLGLLHMDVIQERLEREYDLKVLATVPTVGYRVILTDGSVSLVDNPARMPPAGKIEKIEEPFVSAQIVTPARFIGSIMKLAQERRGVSRQMEYIEADRATLSYDFPLSEIIFDFYDRLKSVSRGYASFDYSFDNYREGKLVKLDIMINGNPVDALSTILHRTAAPVRGRELARKLRSIIDRQLFEVVIQAAIGSRVIARETVKPLRKNVTAKCYGGDITRKRKLLERQREGKRRLKQIGNIQIPQEAFMAILARE